MGNQIVGQLTWNGSSVKECLHYIVYRQKFPPEKRGMLLSSSSPQTLSYEENSQLAVSLLVTVLNEENRALISLEASSRSEIYLGSNPASAK